ncbi:MAG: O-antigen ligase family protein, partial [Thiothrix litoralis]|uniref:O-antigen ligase family protein n=1 Tax=Thiothrix litoralis TaxID=2891210 RepID=UPI003C75B380
MNIIKSIAFFFMLLLVFALPTDSPTAPEIAGMSLVKISGLMVFSFVMIMTALGGALHVMPGFHMTVLLYVSWVLLSYIWTEMPVPYETSQAINSDHALKTNFYLLMVTFVIFQVVNSSKDLERLYIAAVLGSLWLVFMMVSEYKVTANTVRHEIKGFEAGVIAVYLSMVMPLAIYLLTKTKQWIWRFMGLLYLPAAIFTILITGSRTGSIVMIIGLLGFFPIVMRAGLLGKSASVIIVVIALVAIANTVPQKTIERIFTTGKEISSGTLNERRVIWDSGYEEWAKSPIIGHGVGSFRRIVNSYNV